MFDIYASHTAQDSISLDELELYHLIMDYRATNGLAAIPLSSALSATAGRHAADTVDNIWEAGLVLPAGANLHSWSDAPYFSDHSQPQVMWNAPARLGLSYPSEGFEISAAGTGTAAASLAGYQGSSGHNALLINGAPWNIYTWDAIGIGIEYSDDPSLPFRGNITHVWFGNSVDAAGPPLIQGSAGADVITGTTFDDSIAGGAGNDTIDGGAGNDTAVLDVPQASVTVTEISNGLRITSAEGTDDLLNFASVAFSDGTASVASLLAAATGQRLTGTSAPDALTGGSYDDTITGAAEADTLSGGPGRDDIRGGIGFDQLFGEAGHDTLYGNDGYDTLSGGEGNDSLIGNNGFDNLSGGAGHDTLLGGLGPDTLQGDGGQDLLSGQQGFDSLQGGGGDDTLNGNSGADALFGDSGDDLLNGGINNDTLHGDDGNDTLNGNNGSDSLLGGAGDDRLEGNAGADTLDGGAGTDVLRGGIGRDTFVFGSGDAQDRIADFQPGFDRLEMDSALPGGAGLAGLAAYASNTLDGSLMLTFGADSLTFTGISDLAQIQSDIFLI